MGLIVPFPTRLTAFTILVPPERRFPYMAYRTDRIHPSKYFLILFLMIAIALLSLFLLWIQSHQDVQTSLPPKFHFYVILQNEGDPYWQEVARGVKEAADKYHIAVEMNSPKFNNPEEELSFFDIAVTSRVDGIITHVPFGMDFSPAIEKAYERKIPVVTIENDAPGSQRNAFVGTNSFLLGKEAGVLMERALKGNGKIGVIVSDEYESDEAIKNLKISGFLTALKGKPNIEVVKIATSKMGMISAEDLMQSFFKEEPDINAIYATNSVDTLGAAQAIVDLNKVGKVTLIGYGDVEEIIRYIRKGIIYGTVMSDPYKMGYESVKALLDIKEKETTSTFIDTGVHVITAENLQDYISRRSVREE